MGDRHEELAVDTTAAGRSVVAVNPNRRRGFVSFGFAALSAIALAAVPVENARAVAGDAPVVQMLVPGFSVRELPVKLRNLNNLVYASDGRLFALGYDGYVWRLKDTDGDGVEDAATAFFDNAKGEIPPSIGMCWGPGGLYIASRGRIIHLRDKGDDTGELVTVTSGWVPPTAAAGSNLDAIGIAADASGNIFFGLGTDAWNGAYRVNKQTRVSEYNLYSERGTIIRLSPDGKRRDIVATGLRFPVSLAFNAAGDLFCSDQEGATWLANGNPFDELLHIERGRHYGFPPRHPKHLPGVIDEPSVFDYGPQHQSTCGVHFNEPVAGGDAIFGPAWWRGDALVAGESRGKIWRTKLVKTPAGYVAKNELIAALGMLTIDAVPTPRGELLVACHSGKPDWGTGPKGEGKIFRITYDGRDMPQPVLAYAASPTETRVVFDRPVDPTHWRTLARGAKVEFGPYVAAGDRFETLAPPYQVVKDQAKVARQTLPVLSAGIAADRRSVSVETSRRTEATNYAVMLPEGSAGVAGRRIREGAGRTGEIAQHAAIDVLTGLTGIEAEWRDEGGAVQWRGWLPHFDLQVARELTAASEEHRRLFERMKSRGTLALRGQMNLHLMLRTAVQPGAKIDFEYPIEHVVVEWRSPRITRMDAKGATAERVDGGGRLKAEGKKDSWVAVAIEVATGEGDQGLAVSWHTAEDMRPRALPLRRVLLPWATPRTEGAPREEKREVPEIAGGDWARGRDVFFGAQAACSACHQVRGEGGVIGPDLSNLVHRDYASVLRDIVEPSATINPDRLAYNVELKDGSAAVGILLEDTAEKVVLGDVTGKSRAFAKSEVKGLKALEISLMPPGLWEGLSAEQRRDLMTFLLVERKQ